MKKTNRIFLCFTIVYLSLALVLALLKVDLLLSAVIMNASLLVLPAIKQVKERQRVVLTKPAVFFGVISGLAVYPISILAEHSFQGTQDYSSIFSNYDPFTCLLVLVVMPAFAEELLFRKYFYEKYRTENPVFAIILVSGLFACMHTGLAGKLYAFFAAFMFTLLAEYTNIWGAIIAHAVANAVSLGTYYADRAIGTNSAPALNISIAAVIGLCCAIIVFITLPRSNNEVVLKPKKEDVMKYFTPSLIFAIAITLFLTTVK